MRRGRLGREELENAKGMDVVAGDVGVEDLRLWQGQRGVGKESVAV
jgi:hypothetical protein